MNIILLSGGSGKRLWPLSNDTRSKQFLSLLTDAGGARESMVQRVYRQIQESGIDARIVIATSAGQLDPIRRQLGEGVEVVTEPERRDTFPAISLAAAYLFSEEGCGWDEPVVVMPVDPYTELSYFQAAARMEQFVREGVSDIVLMGIAPTYAAEKYGYILPRKGCGGPCLQVERFVEKPGAQYAHQLIQDGALWNAGVFAFRLGYVLDRLAQQFGSADFETVRSRYGSLEKTSFDYAVVEKASRVAMVPFDGLWKDLGTWNTLAEEIDEDVGHVVRGEGTEDTQIVNELGIPLIALGVKDLVIAASPDGILVASKDASSYMKPYVEKVSQRPMYEERRWGYYKVLDYDSFGNGCRSLTKRLFVAAGKKISYQSHAHRDEIWTIVEGTGTLLLDGHTRNVKRGDVAYITAGMKHALCAVSDLHLVEVQLGSELAETDIVRYAMDWQ